MEGGITDQQCTDRADGAGGVVTEREYLALDREEGAGNLPAAGGTWPDCLGVGPKLESPLSRD